MKGAKLAVDESKKSIQNRLSEGESDRLSAFPPEPVDCFFFKGSALAAWDAHPVRRFELLYVTHGSFSYLPAGLPEEQAVTLTAGQYFLSDRPLGQSIRPSADLAMLGCYFSPALFSDDLPEDATLGALLRHPALGFPAAYPADELCRRVLTDSNGRVFKLLESAMQACESKGFCRSSLIRAFLTIVLILTAHRTVSGTSEAGRSRIVSYLCNYVQSNYASNISLSEICRSQYLNASFISRKFKETAGVTFEQYLQNTRVQNAKLFLSSTDLSIEEISVKVGYTDPGSFRKIFKRICGVSPTEFRRSHA